MSFPDSSKKAPNVFLSVTDSTGSLIEKTSNVSSETQVFELSPSPAPPPPPIILPLTVDLTIFSVDDIDITVDETTYQV